MVGLNTILMHVSPRENVPQIMREGPPLTINQYTKVNWPFQNKLGIFNVTLGGMLGNPMGINNSRIKYEHQRDKSEHFTVMDK